MGNLQKASFLRLAILVSYISLYNAFVGFRSYSSYKAAPN